MRYKLFKLLCPMLNSAKFFIFVADPIYDESWPFKFNPTNMFSSLFGVRSAKINIKRALRCNHDYGSSLWVPKSLLKALYSGFMKNIFWSFKIILRFNWLLIIYIMQGYQKHSENKSNVGIHHVMKHYFDINSGLRHIWTYQITIAFIIRFSYRTFCKLDVEAYVLTTDPVYF